MPKPTYPARRNGGFATMSRRPRWAATTLGADETSRSAEIEPLVAEIERLRSELAIALNARSATTRSDRHVIWVALAVCATVLAFSVMAILNHG